MENDPGQTTDITNEEPEMAQHFMQAKEKWELSDVTHYGLCKIKPVP